MKDIVVRGDLGYLADDPYLRKLERKRQRYHSDPDFRAYQLEKAARWHAEHREQRRAYNREWMRRYRATCTASGAMDRPAKCEVIPVRW